MIQTDELAQTVRLARNCVARLGDAMPHTQNFRRAAAELSMLFGALDDHLTAGGQLPEQWQHARPPGAISGAYGTGPAVIAGGE